MSELERLREKTRAKTPGKPLAITDRTPFVSSVRQISGVLGSTFPDAGLSAETREIIEEVIRGLVDDCMSFYADDQAIFEQMNREGIEFAIVDFLSKKDWYTRNLTEAPKPGEPTKLKNRDAGDRA